jgi:hypothetical protein
VDSSDRAKGVSHSDLPRRTRLPERSCALSLRTAAAGWLDQMACGFFRTVPNLLKILLAMPSVGWGPGAAGSSGSSPAAKWAIPPPETSCAVDRPPPGHASSVLGNLDISRHSRNMLNPNKNRAPGCARSVSWRRSPRNCHFGSRSAGGPRNPACVGRARGLSYICRPHGGHLPRDPCYNGNS